MMWAYLLLAGILSGWWGAFALAAAPPANSAFVRTIGSRDRSGNFISDSGRISQGILSSVHIGHSSTAMMTTTMTTSSRSFVRKDLPDVDLSTSLPATSKTTTTNYGLFSLEKIYPRDNWNDQQREDVRRSDQTQIARTIEPFGIESTNNPERDLTKNHGNSVERRKESSNVRNGFSMGPLLENFVGYQVTPTSLQQDSYDRDHVEQSEIFATNSEHDATDVSNDEDTSFEDLNEIQDYTLDDEEWPRESRKFDSTSKAEESIYPSLGPVTHSTRDTSLSSSASTATLWAEIFRPIVESSIERTRVSRSTKQQHAKNRTRSESPREQRRKCRNKGCPNINWCPDMDIGNRAFLAPTVFEGKARSMSSPRKPGSNYAVTFEVKQVYKSQPNFQPLQKSDSVRLHFRDKATPGKSTLCSNVTNDNSQQQQNNTGGLVRANIQRGKVYLVFVNRVGPRNFTILGEPVIRSKKNEQAVQAVIRPDYVRQVTLSELRDSVARLRDRVKLVCRTRGSPPPRVHWLKDGVPLQTRKGLRIQHKRRRSKVVIASARQEDSGRYECVAESTSGHRASLTAQLLVAQDTIIQETTTVAWPRQEQPCPITGDYCMNGGTCLFFETVGEPACRCAEGFTGLRCETKDVISTGTLTYLHNMSHYRLPTLMSWFYQDMDKFSSFAEDVTLARF